MAAETITTTERFIALISVQENESLDEQIKKKEGIITECDNENTEK